MFTLTIKLTDIPNIQADFRHYTAYNKKSQLVTFASGNKKKEY